MSYILEALKRSEQERAAEAVPSLHSSGVGAARGIRRGWLVTFMVVLVAAAAAGMKIFWSTDSGSWSSQPTIDTPVLPAQAEAGTAGETQTRPSLSDQRPAMKSAADPLAVSEFDPLTQQRLPALVINALSYSTERSKRFVMINQSIFREGDELGDGLSVEQIMPAAVILKFGQAWITLQP